jgi:hypothetical protein
VNTIHANQTSLKQLMKKSKKEVQKAFVPQNNKPLSREFLASRGVCCGNMCANCCYYPRHTAGTTQKY